MNTLTQLLVEIRGCSVCAAHLPEGPRPILQAGKNARLVIIGQAPGRRVHASGIPWDDVSGDTLRSWLGIDRDTFYDPEQVALVPMGFCYPGTGKSGDLPPRPECAPLWHEAVLGHLPAKRLMLLIGQYAQARYLGALAKANLTETVRLHAEYGPDYLPLPHPSPRNRPWLSKNPWFAAELLPLLRERVGHAIAG